MMDIEEIKKTFNMFGKIGYKQMKDLIAEVERLNQCLQDILNPLSALERDLPEGYRLNGGMVVHLLNNPQTYKDIAKRGLEGSE
jgi:hypothetical protein